MSSLPEYCRDLGDAQIRVLPELEVQQTERQGASHRIIGDTIVSMPFFLAPVKESTCGRKVNPTIKKCAGVKLFSYSSRCLARDSQVRDDRN